jgi:hypothetical protein
MINIYIACSLTHVPRNLFNEYTSLIHEIAKNLSEYNVKYALIDSDPQLDIIEESLKAHKCYEWDRKMVESSDLIIAEASFPSAGLGIELQIAENKNIPIVLIYKDYSINKVSNVEYQNPDHKTYNLQIGKGIVSLMALGLPNIKQVLMYGGLDFCITELTRIVSDFAATKKL